MKSEQRDVAYSRAGERCPVSDWPRYVWVGGEIAGFEPSHEEYVSDYVRDHLVHIARLTILWCRDRTASARFGSYLATVGT